MNIREPFRSPILKRCQECQGTGLKASRHAGSGGHRIRLNAPCRLCHGKGYQAFEPIRRVTHQENELRQKIKERDLRIEELETKCRAFKAVIDDLMQIEKEQQPWDEPSTASKAQA